MLIFSSFIFFSSLIIFKGYKLVAWSHISKNNTYLNMISMAHFVRLCFYIQTLTRRLIYGGPLSTMGRSVTSFQTDVDLGGAKGSKIQSVLQMLLMDHSWIFLSFNLLPYIPVFSAVIEMFLFSFLLFLVLLRKNYTQWYSSSRTKNK